ncbi:type II toxin-antitoxin system RelE/ParE family toxin [Paenibacillus terreus]|uniref:Type II toxin-antitoxin system RelE/ParE family toxin n=1 Tax=Paenibacillus terreus TaxID=1387834 RepID=A0ABV5BGY2_9BACL
MSALKLKKGRGIIVPEMDDPNLREVFIHRYRLIYQIHNKSVIIKTIVHGAREISNDK